jgi:hypothetical protein
MLTLAESKAILKDLQELAVEEKPRLILAKHIFRSPLLVRAAGAREVHLFSRKSISGLSCPCNQLRIGRKDSVSDG